ncbi:MAG: hypothetical protein AAGD13_01465 [Pseudomonadota bacterium]
MDISRFNFSDEIELARTVTDDDAMLRAVLTETELNLRNVEFVISDLLHEKAVTMDVNLRARLAHARDAISTVAQRARRVSCEVVC